MPAETAVAVIPSDMDSPDYFFEGVEKLLELWFGSSNNSKAILPEGKTRASHSLRSIPRAEWDALMEIAACRILHTASSDAMDSYVLSESSLFVSDTRVILKTCGSTKLLAAVPRLLEIAATYAGLDMVMNVYYSRKNFSRPDLQPPLYRNFDDEMNYLNRFFQKMTYNSAYTLGSMNSDRWYLYSASTPQAITSHADHTLEILMTEMPVNVLEVFTKSVCEDGPECTVKSGIARILPKGTIVHEELFDPCGYSMNGLVPNSDKYVTIHVTPEEAFSYASFETNQDEVCLYAQAKRVLQCFRPSKFLLTVFSNEHSPFGLSTQQKLWDRDIVGYRRTSVQYARLETEETLVYAHFVRNDDDSYWMISNSSSDEDEGNRSDA